MVPCPAMVSGWSNGGMYGRPCSWLCSRAHAAVPSNVSPTSSTVAPSRRTLFTLMDGVAVGIATMAEMPNRAADIATLRTSTPPLTFRWRVRAHLHRLAPKSSPSASFHL
jgi:hypothetical protein